MRIESPARAPTGAADYMPQLDGLRAIAVLLVLFGHWQWQSPLARALNWGMVGVVLFFVLSGFLITRILLSLRTDAPGGAQRSRPAALRHFYARRALRILPACYLLLLASLALGADFRGQLGWFVAFAGNHVVYSSGSWDWPAYHLWTLAVEEQFYLAWPLALLFLPRRRLAPLAWLAIALGPVSRALLFLASDGSPVAGDVAQVLAPSCADSFGLGALLALHRTGLVRLPVPRRRTTWLQLAGLALLAWACREFWAWPGVALFRLALSLLAVALVAGASRGFGGPVGGALGHPVPVFVGRISYGMYLYHLLVPDLLVRAGLPEAMAGAFWVRLVALLALATLSWRLVERPLLDWGARRARVTPPAVVQCAPEAGVPAPSERG